LECDAASGVIFKNPCMAINQFLHTAF